MALGAVAGLLLVSAALLGQYTPLRAQEGDGTTEASDGGVRLRLRGLSDRPTHLTVDGFAVELANLDATASYQVVVSSSRAAALGIGACGTASQTRTVTGVASQTLRFVLYACAVSDGTIRAEVRRTGGDAADASASRHLRVLALPDDLPEAQQAARGAVPRAGTPGIVSGIHFDTIRDTSFRVKWSEPSDGDSDIWSYGILLWTGHVNDDKPGYGNATTITSWTTLQEDGIEKQAKTFSGLVAGTTHHYLMHACNQTICGHWSYPAKSVTTTGTAPAPDPARPPPPTPIPVPDRPHSIKFHDTTSTSVRVTWSAAANTGGAPLTGFDLRYWPHDSNNPTAEPGATTQRADGGTDRSETVRGLAANTTYELKMRACNQANNTNCSAWSADHGFTTDPAPTPAPGAPSFGSMVALTHNFLVGQTGSVTLPAASGGSGVLQYRLAPLVGNGLTFDGATRTLAGTPQAAANLATYTYTVTDAANKTAQLPFHVTVFAVNVRVDQGHALKPLPQSRWGVLGHAVVLPEAGFTRTDGHQIRLRLPASTGFEFGRTCQTYAAPTATSVLASPWADSPRGLELVRCGLGAGAAVSFDVQVRRGTGGTPALLYTGAATIPQAKHRNDHRVIYYITGTLANGDIDGGQMFPAKAGMTPNQALTQPLNYQRAAKAWQHAPANVGVTLDRLRSGSSPDVVISGYWDPGTADDQCTGSVACVFPAGYPHLGNGQVFVIEDPPRWPKDPANSVREWTTEITDWLLDDDLYAYLPRVLMHEFGHTLGLGDSTSVDFIMGRLVSPNLADTDVQGLRATYAHHRVHD